VTTTSLDQRRAGAPGRSGLVLLALILVAAVANLNLSVANVALPEIGRAFDASQTEPNLAAVGYSLGLAASVLYLGAIGDRYGRKLMCISGVVLSVPACLVAAYAPNIEVLTLARIGGGLSAGMAYPTTLALITALWAPGAGRTKSIALWSALGGAIAALGPLVSGVLLEHYWWGSVFLITLPLAAVAFLLAMLLIPAHVNEGTEPVDNLGGILSVVLVAALILAINFAPVPNEGALVASLALVVLAAGVAFVMRQRRASNPLYDLDVAARPTFWVAACAGIIVFGSVMGAMYIGQQFVQNVFGLLDRRRRRGDAAGGDLHGHRRAALGQACRGARRPSDVVDRLRLRVPHHAAAVEGERLLLAGRSRLCLRRHRRRLRRHAGLAVVDRVGPGAPGGDGVGHRRPPA